MTPPATFLQKASQLFDDVADGAADAISDIGSLSFVPGLPLPITSMPFIAPPTGSAGGDSFISVKNCGSDSTPIPCVMVDIGKLLGFTPKARTAGAFAGGALSGAGTAISSSFFSELWEDVKDLFHGITEYFEAHIPSAAIAQQLGIATGAMAAGIAAAGLATALSGVAGHSTAKVLKLAKPQAAAEPPPPAPPKP